MTLILSSRRLRGRLLAIAATLTIVSLGARLLNPGTGGWVRLVDLDAEMNFPAWYSSLGLAASALLLGAIARLLHRAGRREFLLHWAALGAMFALLSAEEIVGIHEVIGTYLRRWGGFDGYFYFAWVIPGGVGLCLFGLAYLRFLLALPVRTRNQFVAAGAVYALGVLGIEMIGGKLVALYTKHSTAYVLCYHAEEFLELCGIALFNTALIEHLAGLLGPEGLRLSFSRD